MVFVNHVNWLRKIEGIRSKTGKKAMFSAKLIASPLPTPKLDSAVMICKLISNWLE